MNQVNVFFCQYPSFFLGGFIPKHPMSCQPICKYTHEMWSLLAEWFQKDPVYCWSRWNGALWALILIIQKPKTFRYSMRTKYYRRHYYSAWSPLFPSLFSLMPTPLGPVKYFYIYTCRNASFTSRLSDDQTLICLGSKNGRRMMHSIFFPQHPMEHLIK